MAVNAPRTSYWIARFLPSAGESGYRQIGTSQFFEKKGRCLENRDFSGIHGCDGRIFDTVAELTVADRWGSTPGQPDPANEQARLHDHRD